MADRVEADLSFTPIVTMSEGSDSDAIDAIHHDIKEALGGRMVVTARSAADKWYYAPSIKVGYPDNSSLITDSDNVTDLEGASGNLVNPNEAAGVAALFTDGTAIVGDADNVLWIYIKNTGTSDIYGTKTTASLSLTFESATINYNEPGIEIAAGEAFMTRLNVGSTPTSNIEVSTMAPYGASDIDGSTGTIITTVVALINDAA